jgi:sugar/nucleoside kinase (ribokinase family)
MKPRTISIGGATYDLFVSTDKAVTHLPEGEAFVLPLGHKIAIDRAIGRTGGGASNTSVGLARLGCDAAYCGILSDDQWGHEMLGSLKKEHVRTDSATVLEGEYANFSIILSSPTGERVILAHSSMSRHLHDVTFDRSDAQKADWIYLNHVHADSNVIEDDLIQILTAKGHPCLTWNPGGHQIHAGIDAENNRLLLQHTQLLLLNKEESFQFAKCDSIPQALKVLHAHGAKMVCITDGKNGSYATEGINLYECSSPDTPVVDTTGAGDAFGTGMTWALLSGKDLPKAMQAGTINAMSVVGAIGAQPGLLTDTEMNSKLASLTIPLRVSSL